MTMGANGVRCAQCTKGRVCSFCLSLMAAKRQEAEAREPKPVPSVERKSDPEPEQGSGWDTGYDYSRGEYRIPRRILR